MDLLFAYTAPSVGRLVMKKKDRGKGLRVKKRKKLSKLPSSGLKIVV